MKIARDEVEEVNALREKWSELLSFASEVKGLSYVVFLLKTAAVT